MLMGPSFRFRRLVVAVAVAVAVMISAGAGAFFTIAQANSVPDKPTGLVTLAGDTQVQLSWDDPKDTTISKYQLWQLAQSAKLTANITKDNRFGYSVAVDVDTAVIGVPGDDTLQGSAYVFTKVSGVWSQPVMLTASGGLADDEFGISVAVDGDTVVVGGDQDGNGAAYVYIKPASIGGWADSTGTETAKLTASGGAADDKFGISVAVDGDTVVVGGDQNGNGAAYVFTKPDTGWADSTGTETAKLTASDGAASDEFGISVAVDGDTVVVGGDQNGTGAAYVYIKPASIGGWADSTGTETAKLTAFDGAANDKFGISVAVDGDTVVVGASGNQNAVEDTNVSTGAAYVFTEPNTGWGNATETAKLTASDRASDDEFGISVAVDGETVVVGAHKHDIGSKSNAGAAYVYIKPGSVWADATESAKPTASGGAENDEFGSSVAVDGDTVLVGAYAHDNGDSAKANSGAAYVFEIMDWRDWYVIDWDDIDDDTISYIVTGLTNDIAHTFRIRAVNGKGVSDPSDFVEEIPAAASYAPARPVNFSAEQAGSGEVELMWDAHLYPLTVAGYEYRQDDGSWTAIAESDSRTVSHTVTNLTVGIKYTFAVRAVNSAFSTASDSRSVTIIAKLGKPNPFITVAGDGHVWLGWRSPADFTISGYQYQQDDGDWFDVPGSRAGTTFHIVTGLTNGTPYTFRVRAVNAAGSVESRASTAMPVAATLVPAKPEGFSVKQVGVGEVELTWDPSANPLNVTSYQFQQDTDGWVDIARSDHSTVSHLVSGLDAGDYDFAVRAKNSVDDGVWPSSSSQSVKVVPKPAAPTGLSAEKGDTQVRLTWNNPGNTSITRYQLLQFPESIKLISKDLQAEDELGWSVAVDGDTLVMGALGDEPDNTGAAYVFTRDGGGWTQMGKLTADDRTNDAGFGHSVAVHGDTIVVGAYQEDHGTDYDAGAAYVFTKPANGWGDMTQTARLIASDAANGDEFGTSVAVHGDTIVVGAAEEDQFARGSAYIFAKSGDFWGKGPELRDYREETANLRGRSDGDRFGRSVAVHGDVVVVGSGEQGDNNRGEVYVFTKSAVTGVWDDWDAKRARDATAKLTANNRGNDDWFGVSVAMDGDTIVVGAPFVDENPDANVGSAYVFTKPATGWDDSNETAKLAPSDGAKNDNFGYSVAFDGDNVVVGAHQPPYNEGSGEIRRPGKAYIFTEPANGWGDWDEEDKDSLTAKLTAYDGSGNDQFGHSVAADGGVIVVGAFGDASSKGSAYVFRTGGEWTDIPGSGAGTTSHIARGLLNDVKYKYIFEVRAVNAAGPGTASVGVEAKPEAEDEVPVKPAGLSVAQDGVGQVRLAWTASTAPLTITGYQLKQNSGTWTDIERSDSSTVSHAVTGLDSVTESTFAVRAKNSAGEGDSSENAGPITLDAQAAVPGGFTADVGNTQVGLEWDDPEDDSIDEYQVLQINPSKLMALDRVRGDRFGSSVAVDGDTAVIGAPEDDHDNNRLRSGSAYVFIKDPGSGEWSQKGKLTASDGGANDEFGVSVAIDGETVVVGGDQDGNGAAYVYTKPADGWANSASETVKLTAFVPVASDGFGISVAVDGNTILVGAHQNDADTNNNNEGAAYIFTKPPNGWSSSSGNETVKLVPSNRQARANFGTSVAVDGDTAVIGASYDAGSAYVFTKVSGVWSQMAKLTAFGGALGENFGGSVAVGGDTIVIGAHLVNSTDDGGTVVNDSGAAYVFTKPGNGWADSTETAKLAASDGKAGDYFGYSVAVDGDTIVVGAYRHDKPRDDSGAAYVFIRDSSGGWSRTTKFTSVSFALGYSVALSGATVVAGAPSDTGNIDAAHVFSVPEWAKPQKTPKSQANRISHLVTGLANGQEYAFQVRAVNAAGAGLASDSAGGVPHLPKPKQPTGLDVEAGDTQVTVSWNLPSDALDTPPIDKYQLLQVPLSKLTADVPGINDEFGYSVAIDGDTAVVGAPGANNRTGAAYVYTKDSRGLWGQTAVLTAGTDGAANDEFGYSVAVDGDTVVVGAHKHNIGSNSDAGAAYVFIKPDTVIGWVNTTSPTAKLTATGGGANDGFGISVAVDGDTVVVGAHQHDTGGTADAGAAYIFTKPDTAIGWVDTVSPTAKLTATGGEANDEFGISVAVDGETVVVGAHQRNANGDAGVGGAYVFTKPDTANGWQAINVDTADLLTASDGARDDEFGISVAIEVDTVVVGAHQYQVNGKVDAGGAYVFARDSNSGKWRQGAKLIASDAEANDRFGVSVSVNEYEDTIVVGAHMNDRDNAVTNSGSAYVFTNRSGVWAEALNLAAPDAVSNDHFGQSVAMDERTLLAGAPLEDDGGNATGSAYVMDISDRTDFKEWTDLGATKLISYDDKYNYWAFHLNNDQEYAFRVRAVNAGGNNPSAETRSAAPLLKKPDRPTGLTAEAGSQRVELSWDLSRDSSIDGYEALTLKIDKLTTSDPGREARFGSAVAVDNGTAVVGAPGFSAYRGSAYVFTKVSGVWSQVAKLTASDVALNDWFGYSVAVDRDTVVVGATRGNDGNGAAYVFTKPRSGWANMDETAKLMASDGEVADEFGHSVAVNGDTVVVGARGDDDNGSNSGSAYVFTKPASEGGWNDSNLATGQVNHTETAKLTASDGAGADRFGQSVSVQSTDDGNTVVVGAHLDDGKGSVYVFTEPDPDQDWKGWGVLDATAKNGLTSKLTAFDGIAGDHFGFSVEIDGDTVVVGAQRKDGNRGAAYVFIKPADMPGAPGAWVTGTETARVTASDRKTTDYFGYSVAVHGDVVVIGAYGADIDPEYSDENLSSGAAYVFTKPGNAWVEGTETAKLILPNSDGMDGTEEDDDFGNSVAIDSESIIVGAPFDDVVVEDNQEIQDAGSMYASGIPQWTLIDPSNDTTTSHTVYELIGGVEYTFQVRAVDEAGSSPPSNIVRATPRGSSAGGTEPPNYGPSFVSGNNLTPAVDENAPPGTLVGSPITATDPEGGDLTYYLQGDDASSFGIIAETGQLTVKDPLDYEVRSVYQVTVRVNDGENSSVVVDVDITVTNLDETGTIALSSQQAKVGTALTAEVSDPDGSVTGVTWQWASSPDLVNWQNIAGATSTTYTPVAQDMDRFLRVTVSYADGEGPGKREQFTFGTAVQGLPVPTPTPEPPERDERPTPGPRSTPEPTAAPTVIPTRVAERPAVPRPEAMARPTPETSGIPMPETGAIFVPEPTLLPTPALAPVGTPVLAQDPTAIPTPTTAPAPATPQVAPDDEGGVNGWLITLLAGGAVAIAAGTFFVVWIRG